MATCALTCADAKKIDLVNYLSSLGHQPQKIHNGDYWYLSPLRQERTPSFKVDRNKNLWHDFGLGKGGDLIDFGTLYHGCLVSDLLKKLSDFKNQPTLSLHPPTVSGKVSVQSPGFAGEKKESLNSKIVVVNIRTLRSEGLLNYLSKRCIPLEIAGRYCCEVDFLLYGKQHTVIGFPNKSGGFELRNENFKGSSSPKDVTLIDNKTDNLVVFEGFFSFLSFATINKNQSAPLTNCLILNSLSFFQKSRPLMEGYRHIHLCLDRDTPGKGHTKQAIEWNPEKYIDKSNFYQGRKDVNEWLIHHHNSLTLKQSGASKRLP